MSPSVKPTVWHNIVTSSAPTVSPLKCCSFACLGIFAESSWAAPLLHWWKAGWLQRSGRRSDTNPQLPQSFQPAALGLSNRQYLQNNKVMKNICMFKPVIFTKLSVFTHEGFYHTTQGSGISSFLLESDWRSLPEKQNRTFWHRLQQPLHLASENAQTPRKKQSIKHYENALSQEQGLQNVLTSVESSSIFLAKSSAFTACPLGWKLFPRHLEI